jgi:hypothetical protein
MYLEALLTEICLMVDNSPLKMAVSVDVSFVFNGVSLLYSISPPSKNSMGYILLLFVGKINCLWAGIWTPLQTYFAIQIYRQEVADHFNNMIEDNRRLVVRSKIKKKLQPLPII